MIVIAALMLCEILFAVPNLFARSLLPAGAFESEGLLGSTTTARTTTGTATPTQATGTLLFAADDTKVKDATRSVDSGAKKIGDGKIGEGVEETAKGVGKTVVEGAKFTGEKFKESGKAAAPEAKSAWGNVKDGATSFGHSVKSFFGRLFSN